MINTFTSSLSVGVSQAERDVTAESLYGWTPPTHAPHLLTACTRHQRKTGETPALRSCRLPSLLSSLSLSLMVRVSRRICHWPFRRGSGVGRLAALHAGSEPKQRGSKSDLCDSDDQKNAEYEPTVGQPIVTVYTHVNMYDLLWYGCTWDSSVSKVLQKINFHYQIF